LPFFTKSRFGEGEERMAEQKLVSMMHADRQVADPVLIRKMLDLAETCTVALHDEPYPYIVPMNFGYEWEEDPEIYLHCAAEGHRMRLIRENPRAACNINVFVNRYGGKPYRNEKQDYRSVSVFGRLEIVLGEEERKNALNAICRQAGAPLLKRAPKNENLIVLRLRADQITAKAQYPLRDASEIEMPQFQA